MATHISFTLPVDLSTDEQELVKELLKSALIHCGRSTVGAISELAKADVHIDIVDEYNESVNGYSCCPCCGIDRGYLRGPGSSIW